MNVFHKLLKVFHSYLQNSCIIPMVHDIPSFQICWGPISIPQARKQAGTSDGALRPTGRPEASPTPALMWH